MTDASWSSGSHGFDGVAVTRQEEGEYGRVPYAGMRNKKVYDYRGSIKTFLKATIHPTAAVIKKTCKRTLYNKATDNFKHC